jgi:hypothetical protein
MAITRKNRNLKKKSKALKKKSNKSSRKSKKSRRVNKRRIVGGLWPFGSPTEGAEIDKGNTFQNLTESMNNQISTINTSLTTRLNTIMKKKIPEEEEEEEEIKNIQEEEIKNIQEEEIKDIISKLITLTTEYNEHMTHIPKCEGKSIITSNRNTQEYTECHRSKYPYYGHRAIVGQQIYSTWFKLSGTLQDKYAQIIRKLQNNVAAWKNVALIKQ